MRRNVHFYDWDASRSEVRWVTAWDTSVEDISAFADLVERAYRERG